MLERLEKNLNKFQIPSNDFVDLRYSFSMAESFTARNGRFDSVSHQTMGGIAVRALIDNAWGFTSAVKTDDESIHKAIDKAIRIAKIGGKYAKNERKISDEWVYEGKGGTKLAIDPREIEKEVKFEKIAQTEKEAREFSDKIAQASSTYQESHSEESIVNSIGTRVENEVHVIRLMKSITGREGTKMQNVFDSIGGTGGWELVEKWDPGYEGREGAKMAEQLLDAENPPSGMMNVIMNPSLAGVFIHEAFGHAAEADALIAKNSVLEDKLNQSIGKEYISVYDDPTISSLRGTFDYDSEGTQTKKRTIVENGILKELFHSLETATAFNVEPNGAGRAMNFNVPPIPRMGNTYIDSGDMSLEELAELAKSGVYLIRSNGGYVNPTKGQFYFNCQYGYVIENGKIANLFGNVGMSGMTLEVLKNTIGVGNKWEPEFLGTCGKAGQWVPCTAGGPDLAVTNLVVGGQN